MQKLTDQIEEISKKFDKLIENTASGKKKDGWDKFGILASFISSVLVAGVGLYFTIVYDHREKESQAKLQQEQLEASKIQASAQQRVSELQTIISMTPYLASNNKRLRDQANIIMKTLHIQSVHEAKESASAGKTHHSEESLLDDFAIVYAAGTPEPEKIIAVKKIIRSSRSAQTSLQDQKRTADFFKSLANAPHVPEKVKQAVNEEMLVGLQPAVAILARKLIDSAKKAGINVVIFEGYRSPAKQDSLYALHLTTVKGSNSMHSKGLAFDIVPVSNGVENWNDTEAYAKLGAIGQALGLTWGGSWRTFKDYPHFELREKPPGT